MGKTLVVIDMQNDFIDGVLGTPEAQAIVEPMADFIRNWDGDRIILTQDTHDKDEYFNTSEGKHLPILHCVEDTYGWKINDSIIKASEDRLDRYDYKYSVDFGFIKDGFGELRLAQVACDEEVYFCGVCTDICLIANAIQVKNINRYVEVFVIKDLCAGTTPEMHQKALDVMQSLHINIVNSKEI